MARRVTFDGAADHGQNSTFAVVLTGLLIALLIVAGAATVVAGGLAWATQRRAALEDGERILLSPRRLPGAQRAVHQLRPGDIIQFAGSDYLVEGVVAYDEDGHTWRAGRLVDSRDVRWFLVGMERSTDAPSLRIMRREEKVELGGHPPEVVLVGSTQFTLESRGVATAKISGDVTDLPGQRAPGQDGVERCRWWRYQAPGDELLLVEQWGGEFRVLRGASVADGVIEMIPGS